LCANVPVLQCEHNKLSTTSKGLKGNCTICSEQGVLCISFLPKADCNSASQFSTLLSLTLGSYFTSSHSVQSPCHMPSLTPLANGRCMGMRAACFLCPTQILPPSYHDYCGVNPCSVHQKHGICIKLNRLSYFTYQPWTPKEGSNN